MNASHSELLGRLSAWEYAEYAALALVLVGVGGEFLHEFTDKFKRYAWWSDKGGKVSALVLIAALAFELFTTVAANVVSGQLISELNKEAGVARKEASSANALAKQYEAKIAGANASARRAEGQAAAANLKIAEANLRAHGSLVKGPKYINPHSKASDFSRFVALI